MSRRSEVLNGLASEFVRVYKEWQADDNLPVPDESFWDAVDALTQGFERGEIPAECRSLANAVGKFKVEVNVYDARENVNHHDPHAAFWDAAVKIVKLVSGEAETPLAPLEGIAELDSQKVPHEQIARIYGFRDRHGRWMPELVKRELAKPGSVLEAKGSVDGRDWIDPRVAARQAKEEAAETSYGKVERRGAVKAKQPCPETSRQLWEQSVPVKQAAVMLCRPQEDVLAEFDAWTAEQIAAEEEAKAKAAAAKGGKKKEAVA